MPFDPSVAKSRYNKDKREIRKNKSKSIKSCEGISFRTDTELLQMQICVDPEILHSTSNEKIALLMYTYEKLATKCRNILNTRNPNLIDNESVTLQETLNSNTKVAFFRLYTLRGICSERN